MLFVDVVVCLERDLEAGNYVEGFVIVAFFGQCEKWIWNSK